MLGRSVGTYSLGIDGKFLREDVKIKLRQLILIDS
jgi:hypothetical protein